MKVPITAKGYRSAEKFLAKGVGKTVGKAARRGFGPAPLVIGSLCLGAVQVFLAVALKYAVDEDRRQAQKDAEDAAEKVRTEQAEGGGAQTGQAEASSPDGLGEDEKAEGDNAAKPEEPTGPEDQPL